MTHVLRFDEAIDFYTQEIAANPGESSIWSERGAIWYSMTEYDKAIADFNEAIRLHPTNAFAYGTRGSAWQCCHEEAGKLVSNSSSSNNEAGIGDAG